MEARRDWRRGVRIESWHEENFSGTRVGRNNGSTGQTDLWISGKRYNLVGDHGGELLMH